MDLLAGLNEPQTQAVKHIDGPLLVLAGAGSGKTRVITRRVAYLVSQGIDPHNVMAITFTNKAAEEMRQRVAQLYTPPGATVCTFHALCARLLREFADQAQLGRNYTIYDRNDQLKITKQAIEELNLPGHQTPAKVHAAISNAKGDLQTPEAYAALAEEPLERNIAQLYAKYEQTLAANNAVDFDDLLMRVAFMLRDHADVRQYLAERYRYILIDEYQDTNRAQYIIAHSIAAGHENICATGDPDQSIYAWRGADINNILDFEHDYPGATIVRLEENYRSRQPILTAASLLIANNVLRKSKSLFTRKTGGDPVVIVAVDDERAEARLIADRIEDFRREGGAYSDIALFYRVNSLSRVLEEALIRKGVAYRIARGVEFYNRKEIKDVIAYLKLLVNRADDLSCLRIINTPPRGIGATTVKRLQSFAFMIDQGILGAVGRVEEAGLSASPTKKVRAFAEMIASLAANLERPVRAIMEDVVKLSGMEESLSKGDEDSRQAKSNVDELITTAAEFDESPSRSETQGQGETPLAEYLNQVSLISDADHLKGQSSGAVTLMTLHAAKGLEFPCVFIAGCEEGLLPFSRGPALPGEVEDISQIEEERRLAFVGITRAMEKLTLTHTRSRRVRGMEQPQTPSRFVFELGNETVRREDCTTKTPARPRHRRGGFYRAEKPEKSPASLREDIEAMSCYSSNQPDNFDMDAGCGENPFPPEYEHLKPGCMVQHEQFGLGKLVHLAQSWPDTRATILFHEFGEKKLVLSRTSLELLDTQL